MSLSSNVEHYVTGNGYRRMFNMCDVKQFIKELKKDIDESADKTDIWNNERWDKFRKVLIKAIKKRVGEGLI